MIYVQDKPYDPKDSMTYKLSKGGGIVILLENGAITGGSVCPELNTVQIKSWYPGENGRIGEVPHPTDYNAVKLHFKDNKDIAFNKNGDVRNNISDLVMLCTKAWDNYKKH